MRKISRSTSQYDSINRDWNFKHLALRFSLWIVGRMAPLLRMEIIAPDGRSYFLGKNTAQYKIEITQYIVFYYIFLNPLRNVGVTYVEGKWSIRDGNLHDLLSNLLKCSDRWENTSKIGNMFFKIRRGYFLFKQKYGTKQSKKNVEHHYDIGNDWYKSFLDSGMNYSCADFSEGTTNLDEAQLKKIEGTIARLNAKTNDEVLEIGCGWGELSRKIANSNTKVTGITLSKEQYTNCKSISGNTQPNYFLSDYRDFIEKNAKVYDRIVSIGMFEHVGVAQFDRFFKCVFQGLKPEGKALIHTIVRKKPGITNAWIDEFVFPGGYIVSKEEFKYYAEKNGFTIDDSSYSFTSSDYVKTIEHWKQSLNHHWNTTLSKKYDIKLLRAFEFYFSGSQAAFSSLGMHVKQFVLTKPQN